MSVFNLNNLLMLHELCVLPCEQPKLILVEQNPIAYIAGGAIYPVKYSNMDRIFDEIFMSDLDITVLTQETAADEPRERQIAFVSAFSNYLSTCSLKTFSDIETDNLHMDYLNKLEYKEYMEYLTNTDIVISPIIYQWLENYFTRDEKTISFTKLYSCLKNYMNDTHGKEQLLALLIMLGIYGFIKITSRKVAQNMSTSNEKWISLLDKFSVALFISDSLAKGDYKVTLKYENELLGYNFAALESPDIQDITPTEFFFNLLSIPGGLMAKSENIAVNQNTDMITMRLELFSQVKQLPLELFDNGFEGKEVSYICTLLNTRYAENLALYISYGMDFIDLSLLSMLQIKPMTLFGISERMSCSYAEMYKSLFSFAMLGLVSAGHSTANDTAPVFHGMNKQLLQKIITRIKEK